MIKGLDASSVQGVLPVNALRAGGCEFLIHKCKQGNDGKDPFFELNVKAWRDAGGRVGKYDFLYPLPHLDPEKQAEGFFEASQLGAEDGDIPNAIDLEWPDPDAGFAKWGCTPAQVSEFARRAAERSTVLMGVKPIIYIYPYFAAKLRAGADISWLAEYPLWIASYGGKTPRIPKPWSTWTFWQYDGNNGERMPNGGDADFNWFNGDDEALAAFCQRAAVDTGPTREEREPGAIIHPLSYT
jgi:lysozyme